MSNLLHAQWQKTNKPDGGMVNSVAGVNSVAFAGTINGIYKSTNNGDSWEFIYKSNDNDLMFSFNSIIFAASYGQLHRSTDLGKSWSTTIPDKNSGWTYSYATSDSAIFICTKNGIYKSIDDGVSWTDFGLIGKDVNSIAIKDDKIYAASKHCIFVSPTNRIEWNIFSDDSSLEAGWYVVHLALDKDYIYISNSNGFYRSSLIIPSWENLGYLYGPIYTFNSILFVGDTWRGIFYSVDNGETFIESNLDASQILQITLAGTEMYAATFLDGVYHSSDNGKNWTQKNNGIKAQDSKSIATIGSDLFIGGGKTVFHSPDNGDNWIEIKNDRRMWNVLNLTSTNTGVYVGSWDGLDYYDISKKTWAHLFDSQTNDVYVNKDTIAVVTFAEGAFISYNEGLTWDTLSSISGSSINNFNDYWFIGGNNNIYRSPNWIPTNSGLTTSSNTIWSIKNIKGSIYAGACDGLYNSTNNGNTWTKLFSGYINEIYTAKDNIIIASRSGIYFSKDEGVNWLNPSKGLENLNVISVAANNSFAFALTADGNVSRRPLAEIYVDVNVNKNNIPGNYDLLQNFPNPFNPSTTIKYSIPKSSFVSLKILDILGKEIQTIVNEEKQPGNYEVKFDGSNLASGIYLYQLKVADFVETKKMILLR